MKDIKKLLEIRKERKKKQPPFIRQGYGIYKRIPEQWRKPKGRHSKQRHQAAGHAKKVKPGFGTNRLVKGLDRTGLLPVVIHSMTHVHLLDKGIHGAIIGGNVGNRKRIILLNELKKHGIKVLNLKEGHESRILEQFRKKKEEKGQNLAKKSEKKVKKESKKEEKTTEEQKQEQEKKEKDKIITKEQK